MKKELSGERETNPRENANFLSIITFFYTRNIFKKGIKRGVQEWDIYQVLENFKSEKLGERLEEEWEKQKKKKKKQCLPLLACLFKIFGTQYMLYGLVVFLVKTILMVTKPLAIGKLVSYFDPHNAGQMTEGQAYFYAFILLLAIFCSTLFMHNNVFYIQQLVMRMKVAICGLIYRKSLRLSTPALLKFTSGKAVTLMTKDIACFDLAPQYAHDIWIGIIHVGVMTYLIYRQIGISAFVGVGFLFVLIPVQALLGRESAKMRTKAAAKTDKRLRFTQEILNAIKIIKVYTWENIFGKSVSDIRRREVNNIRSLFCIKYTGLTIGNMCSKIAMCLCITLYAALGERITAEKAFTVMSCFGTLRAVLTIHLPLGFGQISEMIAATMRITEFLYAEEAGQHHEEITEKNQPTASLEKVSIVLNNNQTVIENACLEFKPGLNVVTGSVGSGKSSLLKVLMNEIPASSGTVRVIGEKSYASQDPWLFPETIKQNIIFYKPFEEERYQEVLRICALRKDISLLPEKDSTIVIDKGLNLSRGQQARVNLARAVYHEADIYLLDDCLSAVDSHVSNYIFQECIQKFLKDKICILVSHNIQHLREAEQIIVLDEGKVDYVGTFDGMPNEKLAEITHEEPEDLKTPDVSEQLKVTPFINEKEDVFEDNTLLKLPNKSDKAPTSIYQENQQEGKVPWRIYKRYLLFGGGAGTFIILGAFYVSSQVSSSWSDTFIRDWVDLEPKLGKYEANNLTNSTEYEKLLKRHNSLLIQYLSLLGMAVFTSLTQTFLYFIYNAKLSWNLHNTIMSKILKARMIFFDKNLSGNILNRFSRDLSVSDEIIPHQIKEFIKTLFFLAGTLFVILTVNWFFVFPTVLLAIILIFLRMLYLRAGRGVQRLEGITRSPVVGHVNASLEGLLTIRSNRAQEYMKNVFDSRQNHYYSAAYMALSTSRAFGLMADLTTFIFVSCIILSFLLFKTATGAGNVGLAITQSFMLTGVLQWGICRWADLETRMTSVERILEYESVETEEEDGEKPEDWPKEGRIEYKNVTLRYSKTSDPVLKNINFVAEPKQKIGVVGRTGAGKSSIISVLFKLYQIEGEILIDNKDIAKINTEVVRNNISIIPQDPVLFSGSLRSNLDPKRVNTDKEIWDALEEVEMKKIVSNFDSGLETDIPEGGSNFSVGQRQLLCLARAILRNNKILVLDEATANVDPQTDALIQRTVRTKFKDCTVLTIAHRLNTILDSDKVMVLDAGQIVEYDDPKNLKNNTDSAFHKMLKKAGLV